MNIDLFCQTLPDVIWYLYSIISLYWIGSPGGRGVEICLEPMVKVVYTILGAVCNWAAGFLSAPIIQGGTTSQLSEGLKVSQLFESIKNKKLSLVWPSYIIKLYFGVVFYKLKACLN